ncbi:MAG: twin-arginine translocase TatA/TatE family subunit [Nitrospinae bacterium]|nr:twin-arginine translocase TatA/TatE family subunit [Nitrospinota bacterium]MCY4382202.1 twin-arginine translocase TatA/TatE family subunit [Nitrospinota bacterium]
MFPMNMGIPELLVILAICVLVFGAKRLPEIGSGLARGIKSFKKGMSDDPELPDKKEASAAGEGDKG